MSSKGEWFWASSLLAVALGGCGPASVSGSFEGTPLSAVDAVATSDDLGIVTVGISSWQGVCGEDPMPYVANGDFIQITVAVAGGDDADPGEYTIFDPASEDEIERFAFITVFRTAETCGESGRVGTSTSGTVTIDSIDLADGGRVAGSFDAIVDGEPITGTFNAPVCDELAEFETCEE
jgi:hypothetical protein